MGQDIAEAALQYHRQHPAGKIAVVATKPLASQRDLALAYTPGVAAACEAIVADPGAAAELTARGNLVAVVTNGTAVLGLGAIGPLAAKPVMEGKAVLFKKFAGIDVFDIEIDERDPDKLVEVIAALAPTFGGINLEDIKAPECFEIEAKLRGRLSIPVFHDDQHGTAIIVAAAILNGLRVVGKKLAEVRLVTSGAGAAAIACLDLLVDLGLPIGNIIATDIAGVVWKGRGELMDPRKERYARETPMRALAEAIAGADVFLGLSAPRVLKPEMVATMAARPLILALANPTPEILPDEVKAVRDDAVVATGRSDFPNQVNNVLCFPFIFRGALDVGATTINEAMKIACVRAIADLATAEPSEVVAKAYGDQPMRFGPDFLIPKPFDPRLITEIAPAVARAAMDSGVATRPIADLDAYRQRLTQFVWRSGQLMRPLFDRARAAKRAIVYCEGEDERVLRAAQTVLDEGVARPILIGRPEVVERRIEKLGLRIAPGRDFELCNPDNDPRFTDYWRTYHQLMGRRGISPDTARTVVRTRNTVIGALMVRRGEADGMLCGINGRFQRHLRHVVEVLGLAPGIAHAHTLSGLILEQGALFMCDTNVVDDPTAEDIAEMTMLAAEEVRRFGIQPRVALLSHASFGNSEQPSARKMRRAVEILGDRAPDLEVDGEMTADAALDPVLRNAALPNGRLSGEANLLVMPNLDAANIAYTLLKQAANALPIGPILMGVPMPAHVLVPSVTVRGLLNMTAITAVNAASAHSALSEPAEV
jgi:malate dehydrogenase (oxaloacetate-decarboxylating)(NADP+)